MNLKGLAGTALVGTVLTIGIPSAFATEGSTAKWSSIAIGLTIVLGFLLKNELLGNRNIEQGEYGLLRRWGKIVVDKETGLPTLRTTGKRHFYIKHVSDYLVQNVRTRITPAKPTADHMQRGIYHGRVVEYIPVLKWRVEDDARSVMKSLVALAQVDRTNVHDPALENYVYAEMCGAIAEGLSTFTTGSEGQPLITIDPSKGVVPNEVLAKLAALKEKVGVVVDQVSTPTIAPTPEQVLSEGLQTHNSGKRLPLGGIMGSRQANRRP